MGVMRAALHVKDRYINFLDNQRYGIEQERDMLTFEGDYSKAASLEHEIARLLKQRQRAETQRRSIAAKLGGGHG
jgi:hypothetical protein